jgi:hypothetical protein
MTTYKISEEGKRSNFTIIPNMIDDLDLSPFAVRLYIHLKRVAGEDGECFQSGNTLSKSCKMSVGSIHNAKKELVDKGLVKVEVKKSTYATGANTYHLITIVDVWAKNDTQALSPHEEGVSPHELPPSLDETPRSPHETIKIPVNKNHNNKKTTPKKALLPPDETLKHPAVELYRGICHRTPNVVQRKAIVEKVINFDDWEKVLTGWMLHGWNPGNTAGMLDKYTVDNPPRKREPQGQWIDGIFYLDEGETL